MSVSRDQIFGASLPREEVAVPEWGGNVFVRTLNVTQRLEAEKAIERHKDMPVHGPLLAYCLCDENGVPLFSEADIDGLNGLHVGPMSRCLSVALRLNKIEAGDIAALEKNS